MVASGKKRGPATSYFRTAVTPDTCIIQDTNSADLNFARHWQFQEKENQRQLLN